MRPEVNLADQLDLSVIMRLAKDVGSCTTCQLCASSSDVLQLKGGDGTRFMRIADVCTQGFSLSRLVGVDGRPRPSRNAVRIVAPM